MIRSQSSKDYPRFGTTPEPFLNLTDRSELSDTVLQLADLEKVGLGSDHGVVEEMLQIKAELKERRNSKVMLKSYCRYGQRLKTEAQSPLYLRD